jgi:hypothetical protein
MAYRKAWWQFWRQPEPWWVDFPPPRPYWSWDEVPEVILPRIVTPEPWDGFPSWTAEPVQADLPERKALDAAQPVQAHESDEADGQPGADAKA